MFPNKLQKGNTLADLLREYNQMVDYLRQTHLVAGPGVSISRLPSGTVLNASRQPVSPVSAPASNNPHPFDAELVNKGTDENPSYYVRIYNSALPDSPYAGVVIVYEWDIPIPVTELAVNTQNGFFVALDVTYTPGSDPPYSITLSVVPYGSGGHVGYTTYRNYIAEGKLPDVASRVDGDIIVSGRWV